MSELEDHVEQIFATVEALRDAIGDGPRTRKLLDELFRKVHNLKATASANGRDELSAIAHEFENLLHSLRTGKTVLDAEALKLLTETSDALFENLPADSALTPNTIPAEIWDSLKEEEKHSLGQAVKEGANLFLVQTSFDVADFDRQFQSLKERLSNHGELISTAPKVDQARAGKINFRILYARAGDASEIVAELSEFSGISVEAIGLPLAASAPKGSKAEDSVRINIDDLDHIISSTHKLFRQTIGAIGDLAEATAIEQSFLKLSAELVNLRMVPVERLLQRASRAGRSAAAATRREIDIVLSGDGLLLDRSISDAMADPLVHLVRNAVDHGIESHEERIKLGKSPRGKVTIEARTFQGQTKITVTDDGRGLDPAIIADAARRLGVVAPDMSIKPEQCLRLLFRPGFSTALEVSGVSGRGVGLDVVETQVEELGGAVRVASEIGQGCSFEISLPVTFGLLDVVLVTVSGRQYLLDASHVTVSPADENEREAIRLSSLLGQKVVNEKPGHSLLCQFDQRTTLLVDEIGEAQQVLIRNLGSRSGRWFGVAGAAELRDGSVALLLDLPRLVERIPDPRPSR